jgi:hypothetical protein
MAEVKREIFVWKKEHAKMLVREVHAIEPFKFKFGSKDRGSAWTSIADNLVAAGLRVTQRSVREKFEKMVKEFKMKEQEEKRASGVEVEYGELEQGMNDIIERIEEVKAIQEVEDQKDIKEKETAEEMRKKATERLKETKKRKKTEDDNLDEEGQTPKKKRSQSGMVNILQESINIKRNQQEKDQEVS